MAKKTTVSMTLRDIDSQLVPHLTTLVTFFSEGSDHIPSTRTIEAVCYVVNQLWIVSSTAANEVEGYKESYENLAAISLQYSEAISGVPVPKIGIRGPNGKII